MDQRPHIVVVEDEAAQRQLLVDDLGKHGFRVSGAEDGKSLRRLVDRELPALVLLDIGLPGEDGFALARWLREKSGRIGIIMVTVASDTVWSALRLGQTTTLRSPLNHGSCSRGSKVSCGVSRAQRRPLVLGCGWGGACWTSRSVCFLTSTAAKRR
jgi:CheY-like chemotaxis protein